MLRTLPVLLACALCGCAGGRVAYRPGEEVTTIAAPREAAYLLQRSPAEEPPQLLANCTVARGDPVGFARAEDGSPFAVAGRRWVPLDDGGYEWVRDSSRLSPGESFRAGVFAPASERLATAGRVVTAPVLITAGACVFVAPLLVTGCLQVVGAPFAWLYHRVVPEPPKQPVAPDAGEGVVDGVEQPQPPQPGR